ncbi:hypothetical protein GRF29_216g799822 [Pseudopithomyces chartarum]|uniref:Uncharacterized protein n=1 Tax=Pseudopithomyces chartarum TaxID=1892770 RepID=A0AAN6LLX2_9PLEO|nr:hypothetical protein GRF29_216g799822 [Pseudopithomyces chartarum]
MSNTFEFIHVDDPVSNPKPGKSLQIRSHCMQGKNKREDSRRSIRERKRQEKAAQQQPNHLGPRPIVPLSTWTNDLSLVHFAGPDIDSESKSILFRAFAYHVANQSLSPLDRAVDFDCLESASFDWLFKDAAFLHSVLCTSYAMSDILYPQWNGTPSPKTLLHLRKTLSLLQQKMSNPNAHQDESVLVVVQNLALLSAVFGDWVAAATHFKGLQKIIELRGNLGFLTSRPKLHFKLDRIDLAYSLSAGKQPFFMHPSVQWDCTIMAPYHPLPDLYIPPREWDWRLVNVFQDFQYLSLRINRNALKRARHNPACFQATLTSLQSRLMHLRSQLSTPVEELVRLTMLAFLTTTFKAPGRKIPYGWVVGQLETVYRNGVGCMRQEDLSLKLWVLITAGYTVAGVDHVWLKEAWEEVSSGMVWDWGSVKAHLLRVMFIELIHDRPGEAAFDELEKRSFWNVDASLLSDLELGV